MTQFLIWFVTGVSVLCGLILGGFLLNCARIAATLPPYPHLIWEHRIGKVVIAGCAIPLLTGIGYLVWHS